MGSAHPIRDHLPALNGVLPSVPKLSDQEVTWMLAQLREHFREPVMPVSRYCEKLRAWALAVEQAVKRTEGSEREGHRAMRERIHAVRLDITKSNLLYRLLYLDEELRTEPCPTHKGSWSGCVPPDRACPYCMSGNNVTGWIDPNAVNRKNAMIVSFAAAYGLSPVSLDAILARIRLHQLEVPSTVKAVVVSPNDWYNFVVDSPRDPRLEVLSNEDNIRAGLVGQLNDRDVRAVDVKFQRGMPDGQMRLEGELAPSKPDPV